MRKRKQSEDEIELAKAMKKTLEKDQEFTAADHNTATQFKKETLRFEK